MEWKNLRADSGIWRMVLSIAATAVAAIVSIIPDLVAVIRSGFGPRSKFLSVVPDVLVPARVSFIAHDSSL